MPIIAGEGITLPGDYLAEFEEEGRLQAETGGIDLQSIVRRSVVYQLGTLDKSSRHRRGLVGREIVGTGLSRVSENMQDCLISVLSLEKKVEITADWKATVEAVLFESGRPVLVVGDWIPDTVGSPNCDRMEW